MIINLRELLEERRLFELSRGIVWEDFKNRCKIEDQINGEGKDDSMLYLVDYRGLYLSIAVKDERIDFFVIRCWKGKTEGIHIFDESIGKASIDSLDAWLAYLQISPEKWSIFSPPDFEKAISINIPDKGLKVVFEFDESEDNNYGFQYINVN